MTREPHPNIHFIIDAGLRAEVIETLRMAGCPCLAQQVLEDTVPDNAHKSSEKVLEELIISRQNVFPVGAFERGLIGGLDMAIEKLRQQEKKEMTR